MSERSWSGSNGEAVASGPPASEGRSGLIPPVESDGGCDSHGDRATDLVSASVIPEPATPELDAWQSTPTEVDSEGRRTPFVWDENAPVAETYSRLGAILAASNDLFRPSTITRGLIQLSESQEGQPMATCDPVRLSALIVDRLDVRLVKGPREKGSLIPTHHLRLMLMSETFLGHFKTVDEITDGPAYLPPDYRLSEPGYNDGGEGQRVFHVGRPASILGSLEAVNRFLDVMAFESESDRANTLAAALTVS